MRGEHLWRETNWLPCRGETRGLATAARPRARAALRALHCTQEFNLSGLLRPQRFETMRAREQARPASTAGAHGKPQETAMPIVQADRLTRIGAALLKAAGASDEEANAVALGCVNANL